MERQPLRVKVCGLCHPDDARRVVELGAWAVGVVLCASSPRAVGVDVAREVLDAADGAVRVGVFLDASAGEIASAKEALGLDVVQVHGRWPHGLLERVPPQEVAPLAPAPFEADWAWLHVDRRRDPVSAAPVGTVDWTRAARLAARRRVVLAGGLDASNVARAIATVGPWGVDVASGVEDPANPRRKSPRRLEAFFQAVRTACARENQEAPA